MFRLPFLNLFIYSYSYLFIIPLNLFKILDDIVGLAKATALVTKLCVIQEKATSVKDDGSVRL